MLKFDTNHELLHFLCKDAQIDGLDFWGPKLVLAHTRTNEQFLTEPVYITIEGHIEITKNMQSVMINANDEATKLNALLSLRRLEISTIQLNEETCDLVLTFSDGVVLRIVGDNGPYESWKVESYSGRDYLALIALPGQELAVFEPTDGELEETSSYFTLNFVCDEPVDLNEFKKVLPIDEASSYSAGDDWRGAGKFAKRHWSDVQIKSINSATYDATELAEEFFNLIKRYRYDIKRLKEKFGMEIYVHFVMNIYNKEMPYVKLTSEQMSLLADIGASYESFVYNYTSN